MGRHFELEEEAAGFLYFSSMVHDAVTKKGIYCV